MSKKITFLLLMCFLFIGVHEMFSVPAVPWPVEKVQPDGSKITVRLRGDEKVHWMESLDGYTLMYDANRYIVYAEFDADKNMVPSKVKYNSVSAVPAEIQKGVRYSHPQIQALERIWEVTDSPHRAGPTTGSRRALCVLMGFSDKAFGKTNAEFETLFNQVGLYPADKSVKGSVRDFFRENSYGQLDLEVTIVGPYAAPNTCKYYATHERELAELAAREANADVDFNDFADADRLETFHILYAGYGDEAIGNGNQIWAHKWQLASPITLDGVRISVYSCSPELRGASGSNITYVGVICHELSHVFGAPDYYDTGSAGFAGTGDWDLMAGGSWNDNGRQPGHINMFQKILYGWVQPIELISQEVITAMPPSATNPVAYTIKANNNGELYVLENKQKVGFDASLPGNGLLIWHVHPSALNGNGSNSSHPQQLYPVVASSSLAIPTGSVASYGGVNTAGAPFPGSSGKNAFTATSTPAMFTWTGPQTISKPITEITENTGDNTISFKFLDGPTVPVTNLQQEVTGGNVKLTWTAAAHQAVLGYKVYRDGILQYTINNKNTVTYTQIGVVNGTYEYAVSAFYESTESEKVTVSVTVTSGSDIYRLPPTGLNGKITLNNAYLNWTAPATSSGWRTIAGSASTVYRFGSEFTFFAGALWGPEHLKGLDGYDIERIRFYLYETAAAATHTVQVWEVDNNGVPQLVRAQEFTAGRTAGSKDVTLTSKLTIDSSKEYLIGVEIHTLGENCFIVDGNSIVPGRNWICEEGDWFPMEEAGFENNFVTSVYLSSGNPSSPNPNVVLDSRTQGINSNGFNAFIEKNRTNKPANLINVNKSDALEVGSDDGPVKAAPMVVNYIIYRDGVDVGHTTSTSFTDSGLTGATAYSYCVSAVYSNGSESEGTCVEFTTLSPVPPYNPVENLKTISRGDEIAVSWNAPYSGDSLTYVTSTSALSSSNVTSATHTQAIRFEPADLKRMGACEITKVKWNPGNNLTTPRTYEIQIWSGGNGTAPTTLVYSQPATFDNNAWGEVTLTSAVPVNIYEDLWIAVKITRTSGTSGYPSPRYTSGGTNGKSNLWHNGTNWTTTNNVLFPITATVATGAGAAPLTGYEISRDGSVLETLSTSTLSYEDSGLAPGNYEYCLTALYGSNKSDAVCASATAETPVNPYKPAENLKATLEANEVTLNWEAPFTGGTIGHSSGTINSAYGLAADVYMAARFTKEDLKKMQEMQLTKIAFGSLNNAAANFNPTRARVTLCVWTGGDANGPKELIYTQPVPSFAMGWNTIDLTTPININIYEELWIGIRTEKLTTTVTIYPGACDAGPVVTGKGDMLYINGAWTSWLAASGYSVNWTLIGHVQPISGSGSPAVLSHIPYNTTTEIGTIDMSSIVSEAYLKTSTESSIPAKYDFPEKVTQEVFNSPENYIISRNGVNIATLANNIFTYEDALSTTGDYTYSIIAKYAGNNLSDSKSVVVSFLSECDAEPTNVQAGFSCPDVTLTWDFTPVVVRKDNVIFNESFETGIPATWSNVDRDEDMYMWIHNTAAGAGAIGTSGFVASASYINGTGSLTPDNWLITPAITLSEGNKLNYYVMPLDPGFPAEHYGVYISTTDTDTESSFTLLTEETLAAPASWQKRTVDLSAYAGQTVYIAFRHFNCTDLYMMQLDEVSITEPIPYTFNIYKDGVKIDQVTGVNRYETTSPDNDIHTYCVSVEGDYCESAQVCADPVGGPCTSVDNIAGVSALKVYPNPVKQGHELYVESADANASIRIFSITGALVYQQQATGSQTKIRLTIPAGLYIMDVNGEKAKIEVR